MNNRYEIRGDVTVIFVNLKGELLEALVDTDDLPRLFEFNRRWYARKELRTTRDSVYVYTQVDGAKKKTVLLHRFIMKCADGFVVDHINHNPLDNRKSNLRSIKQGENLQNANGSYKNSKSGVRGVHWCSVRNEWLARFQVDGKKRTLGGFSNIEDAKACVEEARRKYMPYSQEALA